MARLLGHAVGDSLCTSSRGGGGSALAATLLVSVLGPLQRPLHPHVAETAHALLMNAANPFISEVRVLYECGERIAAGNCSGDLSETVRSGVSGLVHLSPARHSLLAKIVAVGVRAQPSYWQFIEYANSALRGRRVILANADVAFDSSPVSYTHLPLPTILLV